MYQRVEKVTSTLQEELKTKEDLARELREAYVQVRTASSCVSSEKEAINIVVSHSTCHKSSVTTVR